MHHNNYNDRRPTAHNNTTGVIDGRAFFDILLEYLQL